MTTVAELRQEFQNELEPLKRELANLKNQLNRLESSLKELQTSMRTNKVPNHKYGDLLTSVNRISARLAKLEHEAIVASDLTRRADGTLGWGRKKN